MAVALPVSKDQDRNSPANPIFTREGNTDNVIETTFTQDLSVASLSFTTSLAVPFILNYVSLTLTGSSLQTFEIGLDAIAGAVFDSILMSRKQNYTTFFYVPDKDIRFKTGNEIIVTLTNIGTPAITANGVISTIGI